MSDGVLRPTRDDLERLSDEATPGEFRYFDDPAQIVTEGGLPIAPVYGLRPGEDVANARLFVALVNAYRAGDLAAASPAGVPAAYRPELPRTWYERSGHHDDGAVFTYCAERGPVRAHCVLPVRHTSRHQWAWFTVQDRAEAEAAVTTDEPERCKSVSPESQARCDLAANHPHLKGHESRVHEGMRICWSASDIRGPAATGTPGEQQ